MKYFYRKKNTPFIRRLFKTRKNSTVNAVKFLLIVSVVVAFVIPYNIYFSTGNYTSFGVHSVISLLWFVVVVIIIFPISAKSKEPLPATKLKEYKRKILKRQSTSNGSQCIKSKKMRIRLIKTSLLSIILLSFFVNTPVVQIHPFELKSFRVAGEDAVFRTDESVSFSWGLMGTPQKAYIAFGDGNIEDIIEYCSQINGMTCGSLEHRYSLQGKYTPILKVYYPDKTFSKNLDIWIKNEAPLFSFAFNGEQPNGEGALRTSSSPFQAFEDEQVNVTVTLSNQINEEELTYRFNFGDHQVTSKESSTSYAWVNQGSYPVTITVIGNQGELSKQTQYVEVLNKAPQASFKITNGLDFAVGKEIEFTAEGSSDTISDEKDLRYVWDWGDGLMDYGKFASHVYIEAGNYNVTLYVKDDDSLVNQISQIIEIDNAKPEIVLDEHAFVNNTLTVNEGEDVLFTAISQDDDKAIFKLLFYWNFESQEFDPSSLEGFELGGWKNRHVFEDDFEGTASVAAIDPQGEYDSDYSNIRVVNVAPQISVFDANIFANVSFQVYRNDTAKEASFAFNLFRDNNFYGKSLQSFSYSEENLISSNDTTLGFSLLNQWKVIVNTTEVLPADSSFQAFINLVFVNGQELVLSSNELFGGNYGEWEFDLSSEFFDEQNYSYKYPITIAIQIFDPSIDEVQFSMSYQEDKLLEISVSNALPISDVFTSQGIEYKVDVYEQDSKQFASITARKSVFSELFDNHSFPLKEELEIDIYSLIDVYDLLQNNLGLFDLSIIDCLSADNSLDVYALDDDLGNNSLTIDFETKINIEMGNLTSLLNVSTSSYHGPTPFGKIGGFLSTVYEGERVKFVSKANDEEVSGMTFMWDFGDGNFVYSEHAEHAWRDAGTYNVTLAMADPFGNIYYDVKNITILPKAPEIVGPFAFQGTEGSTITLDVEIYDTYKDANNLEYFWYDNKGNLVSSDRKPVLLLNDGTYTYTLVVIDSSGQNSSKDITVTIHSLSPEIYVSSYMYHGIEGHYRFNRDGKLELTAYGLDTLLDSEKLRFSWTIHNGKKIVKRGHGGYQLFSKVTFYCTETTTYQGEVRVVDPEGNEKVATFQIVSIIDSTLDGIDSETEEMLKLSDGSSDTDGDGLTDSYEMTVSNTSYLDPDTDGDLLWDGPTVNGSIGEQAVSTNPLDWDCDDDFLSDGTEYFGWNITVVYFESTTNFHVTSDPLDNDTDNDGLSDYEEYYAGSNPRQADTDNDDLTDDIDPFPSKWDGDEDLLSDYEEIMRGTDYNNADSDQDGLKDGEEVYGWGIGFFTNPLDADTDHDHVSDSAEIKNYLIKLQDEGFDDLDKKVSLSAPISLHFPHHFEQAVAAQISFGISFGEYGQNATDSYGVADEDVQDLYVIITKKDNGVLLANFSTNNTRYFSQVVDVTSIMNNLSLGYDYYGDYEIGIGIPGGSYVQEGHYPGTYSFEDDSIGGHPEGWTVVEGPCTDIQVEAEVGGHKKVLSVRDWGYSSSFAANVFDSGQAYGAVEWWFRAAGTSSNRRQDVRFGWSSLSDTYTCFRVWFDANIMYVQHSGGSTNAFTFTADIWYHLKFTWDSTSGGYDGNGQDQVSFYVDGVKKGTFTFWHHRDTVDKISIRTWASTCLVDQKLYHDAFGYSWDLGYEIGDNEEELYHDYQFLSSGDYSGTYSFEDVTIGGHPEEWTVTEGDYTDIQVEAEVGGHKEVLSVRDWGYSSSSATNVFDSGQAYGAVEWWFRAAGTSSNRRQDVRFGWSSLSDTYTCFRVWFDANIMYVQHSGGSTNAFTFTADTWYHLKFTWDSTSGGYDGNGQDQVSFYVDGVKKGTYTFWHHHDTVDKISVQTWGSSCRLDQKLYHDAFGYSWDPNYNIGDNLKDPLDAGCYLEYFELDFCRYLDPNDPDTDDDGILDGVEMGVLVEGTDILNFIDIYLYNNLSVTPIGNFSATYSFEDESNGTTNTNIGFVDSVIADSNCVATIIDEFEYHNKVLELSDDNSNGKIYAYNTAFDRQNGTLEFWWAQTANNKDSIVYLYDEGTGTALSLYMRRNGQYSWYSGSYHDVKGYSANTWYHNKIIFNCSEGSNGKFTWYIDGIVEATNIDFRDNCQSLDKLLLGTGTGSNGFDTYFDAIGFAWNWTYYEGENYEKQLPNASGIGHYPGTFSFENDTIGGHPEGWTVAEGLGTDIQVEAEVGVHKDVLSVRDWGQFSSSATNVFDSGQAYGAVEWWFRAAGNSSNRRQDIRFGWSNLSDTYTCFRVWFDANIMYVQHSGGSTNAFTFTANIWYHLKFTWDSTSGGYDGNGQDQVSFYVDGVKKGTFTFWHHYDTVDKISIQTWACTCLVDQKLYHDAFGYSWDTEYNVGDNFNYESVYLSNPDEYYLEIPQIGEVSDAQLDVKVKSDGTPEGSGKVFVRLVKEEANLTRSDIFLIDYCGSYDSTQQFTYEKSIDLSPYVTNGQVYGTYHLKIQAFGTVSTDVFNLTKFEIETDTYVLADFVDTVAWITDPAESDTDGDGWNDNYEIFTKGTSPVSVDSDGDDSWDPNDRDPLRDVMLEIHLYKGIFRNLAIGDLHALLQISVAFTFGYNEYYIVTPVSQGTEYANGFGYYQTAYFGDHYYVNIDDDTIRQSNTITMHLQMWHVRRHRGLSDVEIIDGDDDYSIGIPSETYTTVYANQTGEFGHRNDLEVKVKTVAIEKANTLAIFNANTTFNGHYNDPNQRYTLIQLNIPGEGHYLGSESFLNEEIGTNSTNIDFISSDSSDVESYTQIVEDVDGHNNVLRVQEGVADHSDFDHNFGRSIFSGTLEWWWRTSKISGGISCFYLKYGNTDVIRLFMREGRIKYDDGSLQDVMTASSNTWYRMKLVFGVGDGYHFDLYVDGVLKVNHGKYYYNLFCINKLRIATMGDPFYSYFDAFGYSWDSNYDVGDNNEHYSVEGTPFEHGMNVIVVPTELFTHTKLNGYVENGNLDQTPLYHPDEHMFEFTAITRDGNPDKANADVDFLFTRHGISPEDAMDVLDLILWGCVNETLDESNNTIFIYEKIHDYVSTKVNGTMASEMGLPYSVLGYIPWFNTYTSSVLGDEPEPEGGITDMLLWVFCLVNPILNVMIHIQMAMTRGAFYQYLVNFAANIFMAILTALGDLLWTIARAALLIFFYVMLAIELLFISFETLVMGATFLILSFLFEIDIKFSLSWAVPYGEDKCVGYIEFNKSEFNMRIESWITWIYWEFFDLYIPWVANKMIQNDISIQTSERSIIGTEEKEESQDSQFIPAPEDVSPLLVNNSYNIIGESSIKYTVDFFDSNSVGPDVFYGVKLHLITPKGVALEAIEMDTVDDNPDFTKGYPVSFQYTLDITSYNEGLWQYYFTTKDKSTGEIIKFPDEGYLIGSDTSNGSKFLLSPTLTSSLDEYYKADGWKNDAINFTVYWWDMINHTAPQDDKISLCLIPARIDISGYGQASNTFGIKKFEMSPVLSNPNYSNPVKFECSINFNNYDENEIGLFYHYFEANSSNGKLVNYLTYKSGQESCLYGPFIKSITSMTYNLEVSSSNNGMLTSGDSISYLLSCSDPNGLDTSEAPKIIYSAWDEEIEYEMNQVYTSTDEKEAIYSINIYGDELKSGKYDVDIEMPSNWEDLPPWEKEKLIPTYWFNIAESTVQQFSNTITTLGIIPIFMFIAASGLVIADKFEYLIPAGIGIFSYLFINAGVNFISLTNSGDTGGFFGLALACFVLFLASHVCLSEESGMSVMSLQNWLLSYFKFFWGMSLIADMAAMMLTTFFGQNELLVDVAYFISNILYIFPQLFVFLTGANTLYITMCVAKIRGSGSLSLFKSMTKLYRRFLLVTGMFSMLCFVISIYGDYSSFNNQEW